jgi:hypothetical protein
MKSPFGLLKVQCEGAKRLAWFCSVIASASVLSLLFLNSGLADFPPSPLTEWIGILIAIAVVGIFVFLFVGYLIIAIAWVVEGFRNSTRN